MEIVNIEARTYEAMISRFQSATRRVATLRRRSESKELKEWLDSQDICEILGVTKRTVQTLRDTGRLGYTMLGHKIYYRPQDVKKLVGQLAAGKEVHRG